MEEKQTNNSNEFTGKVAFITGGSSGIGQATAIAFAKKGAKVAIADVNDIDKTTVSLIEKIGGEAIQIKTDVTDSNSMKNAVKTTVDLFGRLDFAFNNAGIRNVSKIIDLEEENWRKLIDVNLTGVFLGMKYQLPEIIKTKGAIVNTSSIWGQTATEERAAYVTSKYGVIGLTKTAAVEHGKDGVRVNAIAPSHIKTSASQQTLNTGIGVDSLINHTPLQRAGEPEEIAEPVVWLCSQKASYVNGSVLSVDGGWSAH